jgi:CheY-like chemotaxis protein
VPDDEGAIERDDRVLLVVLSDPGLRAQAVELGRANGFKVLSTPSPDSALQAARQHQPAGIVVGMDLPGRAGRPLLQSMKTDPETRHIPTVALPAPDAPDDVHVGRLLGALEVLEPPVTPDRLDAALSTLSDYVERRSRSLLVVADDADDGTSAVVALFGSVPDVDLHVATNVEDAMAALNARAFDCVVLDMKLPGGSGFDVIRRMRSRKALRVIPVVVSPREELGRREESRLSHYARSMVVKTPETVGGLIDEVALFLHRSDVELPHLEAPQGSGHSGDDTFAGKRILIVDDDARNVFALASALEQHGIDVLYADNGEAGIRALQTEPGIDLVLMDVMMPGMDGYTAMREIRKMPGFRDLPLVALTAKAMPGDRENSLAAGASDYVTKPVDVSVLLKLFRGWWA